MKIDFCIDTEYGQYCAALMIPDDQPMPSDADIENMKQKMLNEYLECIINPPDAVPAEE